MNTFVDDRPALSINDRIVWISDSGPEYGNVRWLGKLPDLNNEWMAGVEFDNPVGSGTGLYKDCQLFETALNHASLVPIIGLIKESDFLGPSDQTRNPPMRPSSSQNHRIISKQNETRHRASSNNSLESSNINQCYQHNNNYYNHHVNGTKNKISYDELLNQGHKINQQIPTDTHRKVRVIPIQTESNMKDASRYHDYENQAPPLPEKPTKFKTYNNPSSSRISSTHNQNLIDPVHEISSGLRKTNLTNQEGAVKSQSITQHTDSVISFNIPKPSFVIDPHDTNSIESLKNLLGKSRGIQGHNNSCYMDATLFSMFASNTLFDSLLFRPQTKHDISEYAHIQRILREDIVIPLRKDQFVGADQVMKFRTMLERCSSVDGLTDQEKDPEEFLTLLLGQILKAEPYLKLSSGLGSFFNQLIVDKDESVILPTVQDLCEQSFLNSTVRLREIPPCLLLQMPRFGRQYKMYSRIMPTLKLDITDILESAPRPCGLRVKDCDNLAKYECKACFSEQSGRHNKRLSSVTYCASCFQAKHFGKTHSTGIEDHNRTKTLLDKTPIEAIKRYSNRSSASPSTSHPSTSINGKMDKEIPRIYMDLFAVLCIETSHYVCFVKCGERDSPWCFFDSMADRRGEQNGYNIPEVVLFEDFSFWTSEKGVACLLNNRDDKLLPEMAKRLICDAYLCFYEYKGLKTFR